MESKEPPSPGKQKPSQFRVRFENHVDENDEFQKRDLKRKLNQGQTDVDQKEPATGVKEPFQFEHQAEDSFEAKIEEGSRKRASLTIKSFSPLKQTELRQFDHEGEKIETDPKAASCDSSGNEVEYLIHLRKKLTDAPSFMEKLANFDIDIFLNFNPDRCLFREHFMKFESKEKQNKDEQIKGNRA